MHEQLCEYKVEEKIYLGVRERKRLNITALKYMQVTRSRYIIPVPVTQV
jgi:hypothetical protein